MNPVEIISKKRDKKILSYKEIESFILGFTNGAIPDYQMSALAMAIYFNGMTHQETADLTDIMLNSGVKLELESVAGIKVDKHSTGGVGDKVSLPLIGIVAAAGIPVPMIAGRGLGHTGGTIDKLEAIPGFKVDLSIETFETQLKTLGACLIGQTAEIAPADRKLYALRDVSGTVASVPLITASIMSKKLAEGANAFTMDVKFGKGAFMQTIDNAKVLAESLVQTGIRHGRNMIAYLTNMDQPLGYKIGNWLEIEESIDVLKGRSPKDLMDITLLFAGTMIFQGGKANSVSEGITLAKTLIEKGSALDKFKEIVQAQGGDISVLEMYSDFRKVKFKIDIHAEKSGFIHEVNALELGLTSVDIGAGRKQKTDELDLHAGIQIYHKVADKVTTGDIIATLFINKEDLIYNAKERIFNAFSISEHPCEPLPLIDCVVTESGIKPFDINL